VPCSALIHIYLLLFWICSLFPTFLVPLTIWCIVVFLIFQPFPFIYSWRLTTIYLIWAVCLEVWNRLCILELEAVVIPVSPCWWADPVPLQWEALHLLILFPFLFYSTIRYLPILTQFILIITFPLFHLLTHSVMMEYIWLPTITFCYSCCSHTFPDYITIHYHLLLHFHIWPLFHFVVVTVNCLFVTTLLPSFDAFVVTIWNFVIIWLLLFCLFDCSSVVVLFDCCSHVLFRVPSGYLGYNLLLLLLFPLVLFDLVICSVPCHVTYLVEVGPCSLHTFILTLWWLFPTVTAGGWPRWVTQCYSSGLGWRWCTFYSPLLLLFDLLRWGIVVDYILIPHWYLFICYTVHRLLFDLGVLGVSQWFPQCHSDSFPVPFGNSVVICSHYIPRYLCCCDVPLLFIPTISRLHPANCCCSSPISICWVLLFILYHSRLLVLLVHIAVFVVDGGQWPVFIPFDTFDTIYIPLLLFVDLLTIVVVLFYSFLMFPGIILLLFHPVMHYYIVHGICCCSVLTVILERWFHCYCVRGIWPVTQLYILFHYLISFSETVTYSDIVITDEASISVGIIGSIVIYLVVISRCSVVLITAAQWLPDPIVLMMTCYSPIGVTFWWAGLLVFLGWSRPAEQIVRAWRWVLLNSSFLLLLLLTIVLTCGRLFTGVLLLLIPDCYCYIYSLMIQFIPIWPFIPYPFTLVTFPIVFPLIHLTFWLFTFILIERYIVTCPTFLTWPPLHIEVPI